VGINVDNGMGGCQGGLAKKSEKVTRVTQQS